MMFAARNKQLANVNMTSQRCSRIFGLRDVGGGRGVGLVYSCVFCAGGATASLGSFSSQAN